MTQEAPEQQTDTEEEKPCFNAYLHSNQVRWLTVTAEIFNKVKHFIKEESEGWINVEKGRLGFICNTLEISRKVIGRFIQAGYGNPQVEKNHYQPNILNTSYCINEDKDFPVTITIDKYRPTTCREVEVEVDVPAEEAQPAKPAVPAGKKTIKKIVCEGHPARESGTPDSHGGK